MFRVIFNPDSETNNTHYFVVFDNFNDADRFEQKIQKEFWKLPDEYNYYTDIQTDAPEDAYEYGITYVNNFYIEDDEEETDEKHWLDDIKDYLYKDEELIECIVKEDLNESVNVSGVNIYQDDILGGDVYHFNNQQAMHDFIDNFDFE